MAHDSSHPPDRPPLGGRRAALALGLGCVLALGAGLLPLAAASPAAPWSARPLTPGGVVLDRTPVGRLRHLARPATMTPGRAARPAAAAPSPASPSHRNHP